MIFNCKSNTNTSKKIGNIASQREIQISGTSLTWEQVKKQVGINKSHMTPQVQIRSALISVFSKDRIDTIA
jgi:hypothetical protein